MQPALKDAQLSGTLAMAVGDAFVEAEITPFDWAQLGLQAGLRPAGMSRQMTSLIDKVLEALPAARQVALNNGVGPEVVETIAQHVGHACELHRAAASKMKDIKPALL